ncbi:MAG TPA: hypothetical protein VJ916_04940 [Anaerovoracaceae bacterium]|nr:hypothetical protein [Anaerovoracaceae bacterium]
MKNRSNSLALICILVSLIIINNAEIAYGENINKTETVYGVMSQEGVVNNIYIVNEFKNLNNDILIDFGNYFETKKLSFEGLLSSGENSFKIETPEDMFYYQGYNKSKELPWKFDISYKLDGSITEPKKLAGESGFLEIKLDVTKNELIDRDYFENYILQISFNLDSEKTENLIADGGTIAVAGSDRIVTYTSIPGEGLTCRFSARVEDFEMDGININGVPFNMDKNLLGLDDFEAGLKDLSNGILELNKGSEELTQGSLDIKDGLDDFAVGSNEYMQGLLEIKNSGGSIASGSNQILSGLNELNNQLSTYNNDELINGLKDIKNNLILLSSSLNDIKSGLVAANSSMGAAVLLLPNNTISDEELALIVNNNPGDDNVLLLIDYYRAALTIKSTYEVVNNNYSVLFTSIDDISEGIGEIVSAIDLIVSEAENSRMDELIASVDTLYNSYYAFNSGLSDYVFGIEESVEGYEYLDDGINDINANYNLFNEGLIDLNTGISELNEETKDIPGELDELTNLMDNSDYKPLSFASSENGEIRSLQFVLTTEDISKEEIEEEKPDEKEELSLWQRILKLFIKD